VVVKPAHFGWLWATEAALIAAILLLYFIGRHHGRLGWHVRPQLFKHLVSAGTVFWLGLICMYLFLKLDRLVLEHFVSYAELGRYSAAQQLNENWITLGLMLAQTLAPAFIYRVEDVLLLRRNVLRLMALTAVVMVCGAIFLDLIAGFVIRHVFGPAFLDATGIFRCAVWLSVPAGIEAIGNLIVLKYQAKYVLLGKWLLALCIALLVDAWLIPRLAGYGALIGLACGYLSAAAVNIYYYRFRLLP
jgi:PST family polysaccharide transporter